MRLSLSSILRLGVVLLMILCIPSCKTASSLALNTKTVKKIPLRAGFYISPEFRKRAYSPLETDGLIPVLVGETIVNGVNDVMRYAFRESVETSSKEGDISDRGFDVRVVPEIMLLEMKHGSQHWVGAGLGGRTSVIFQVRWTISDVKGRLLWSDTITATHNERCYMRWCFPKLMEKTIRDQFQQALEKMTGYDWWN